MAAPPFKVKAVYDYNSPHDEDLNFPNGQIITVTGEEDADWYTGEYVASDGSKKEGIFPRNFVEKYEPAPPPRPVRAARPKAEPVPEPTPPKEIVPEYVPQKSPEPTLQSPVQERTMDEVHAEAPSDPPAAVVSKPAAAPESPGSPDTAPTHVAKSAPKPIPAAASKPPPPAVSEKPTGNSFKDRIAAFNKSAAPPIAPPKPGVPAGSSGFIKKPFVAPPPRKDAYVPPPREPPPQKLYKREEDPELTKARTEEVENRDTVVPVPTAPASAETEDTPKPTSLKDRIALLQKQQLEAQARQAEAAHKKDRAKRPPPKPRTESHDDAKPLDEAAPEDEEEHLEPVEGLTRRSTDGGAEEAAGGRRPSTRPRPSKELSRSVDEAVSREEIRSDANDADQSGAGDTTEDAEEASTGKDDSDAQPKESVHVLATSMQKGQPDVGEEEDTTEDDGEEEEEVDPEIKRRMELRERMAKMSGGMGMYGMFGPPGGMPGAGPAPPKKKKQSSGSSDRKNGEQYEAEASSPISPPHAAPIPIMPMPGMGRTKSFDPEEPAVEKEKGTGDITGERPAEEVPDVEDVKPEIPPSTEQRRVPPVPPQDRQVPPAPVETPRGAPPVPGNRPAPPPPPADSRPIPPPHVETPRAPSPSAGSISDDELSVHARKHLSLQTPTDDSGPDVPPPSQIRGAPPIPIRPLDSPRSPHDARMSLMGDPASPSSPSARRPPPIPGTAPTMPPPPTHARAPPPPPPTGAPPSRRSTGLATSPTLPQAADESEDEVTEYDGDYDTDIAPGDTHKDALKSHGRKEDEESTIGEDTPVGTPEPISTFPPALPPQPPTAQRPMPPPPPGQPPKASRPSMDMPRAAPPPVPPPRDQPNSPQADDDEYDPYRYTAPRHGMAGVISPKVEKSAPTFYDDEEEETLSPVQSQPRPVAQPPPPPAQPAPPHERAAPPPPPASTRPPRQSAEITRTQTGGRKSMDQTRHSADRDYIASDVDLAADSQWWLQRKMPPPIFQNRKDVLYEVEESNSTENGVNMVNKEVYVLFQDYSQTIVTARFNARDASDVSLEQRHEPPPPRLRQDQLENAHDRFGRHISDGASARQNAVVGDGTAQGLILELIKPLSSALWPVGTRAYGALVYANLANATVQQYDEIRAGDIVTLRNARFQGHKGTMHQKYSVDVGKPDHVGIVVDWDGTKKKIRAWEQGRESRKVKMESFKVGDLKSGEVKVWRVMGRGWVGWEEN